MSEPTAEAPAPAPLTGRPSGALNVGAPGYLLVGYSGTVDAVTDETVTIAGHVLPRRLSTSVRHLSTLPPPEPCDHEQDALDAADDLDAEVAEGERVIAHLRSLLADVHNASHPGAFRTCTVHVCREAHR